MSDEAKEDIRKILTVLDEYCDYHLDNCTLCVFRDGGKCRFNLKSVIESYVDLLEE